MSLSGPTNTEQSLVRAHRLLRVIIMAVCFGLLAITLITVAPRCAPAAQAGIYVDGSDSMRGFFAADSTATINMKLYDAFSAFHITPTSQVFISKRNDARLHMYSLEQFIRTPVWGNQTLLDQAFEAMKDDVVVLLTDNVQDAEEQATTSTRDYYRKLEAQDIRAVLLCPLRSAFRGPVYIYKQQVPDRAKLAAKLSEENPESTFSDPSTSQRYHYFNMNGPRALALYVIVRSSFPAENIPKLIDELEKALDVRPILKARPVEEGNFSLKGVSGPREVENAFQGMNRLCPEHQQGTMELKDPNLMLVPPRPPSFVTQAHEAAESRYLLAEDPEDPVAYSTDQEMLFQFYFRLANDSKTIVLGQIDEKCSRRVILDFKQIRYQLHPSVAQCFEVPEGKCEGGIIPGAIPSPVVNLEVTPSAAVTPFVASAAFRIPPLPLNLRFDSIDNILTSIKNIIILAFTTQIPMQVDGTIRVQVPPGYLTLESAYKTAHFTRSLYDQSRIYSPSDIVSYINYQPTELVFDFVAGTLAVRPPCWIRLLLHFVIASTGLILAFLALNFWICHYLKFDNTGESLLIFLSVPFSEGAYVKDGKEVLLCRKGFLRYRVFAGPGFHLKNRSGSTVRSIRPVFGESFQVVEPGGKSIVVECISASHHMESARKARLASGSKRKIQTKGGPDLPSESGDSAK